MNRHKPTVGISPKINIEICMGSSCFARGNGELVKLIQEYISDHKDTVQISLKGSLCKGQCSNGPVIGINGKLYTKIDSSTLKDLLDHHMEHYGHE